MTTPFWITLGIGLLELPLLAVAVPLCLLAIPLALKSVGQAMWWIHALTCAALTGAVVTALHRILPQEIVPLWKFGVVYSLGCGVVPLVTAGVAHWSARRWPDRRGLMVSATVIGSTITGCVVAVQVTRSLLPLVFDVVNAVK